MSIFTRSPERGGETSRDARTTPAPIGPLAKLPVFLNLAGRQVLLTAGESCSGSDAAAGDALAWKADLFLAAGARLRLVVPRAGDALREFCARAGENVILIEGRSWRQEDFRDCLYAVGELSSDEAALFHAEGRRAGLLVNVIDQPAFCDFQFGSIVNRSPLVIGISTDGLAPVLGQAIRRRVEAVLPRSIGASLEAARQVRDRVRKLAGRASRRAFWERFVDLVFENPDEAVSPAMANRLAGDAERAESGLHALTADKAKSPGCGRVSLVGAGPGNPELLTMRAVRLLQDADIVLYDHLIGSEILEYSRREARRMLVGKRAGHHSRSQDEINALMLSLARQGKHVVRLKGGDPGVFGRAGEEMAVLRQAGIPCEIVPGITAALGAAASLGISLTHRDHAHRLQFIPGQGKNHEEAALEWDRIADPGATSVVYMGARNACRVAGQLMSHGLPPQTPVMLVGNATRKDQWSLPARLESLADDIRSCDISGPVLMIVGAVTALASGSRTPLPAGEGILPEMAVSASG